MKSIIVTGCDGMLGHKILQYLKPRFENIYGTIKGPKNSEFYDRTEIFSQCKIIDNLDALKTDDLISVIREIKPAEIINCIGVIKQRDEAREHITSIMINSLLPHILAKTCEEWGGRLIHFSTDCVFSGKKGSYDELSKTDADDLYGKSKAKGEILNNSSSLTIRASMIGREIYQNQYHLHYLKNLWLISHQEQHFLLP